MCVVENGEVWWAELDERRLIVVLSSDPDAGHVRAVQVVPPAGVDITGLGVEVSVVVGDGLPAGVVRFGFPRPGFIPCTWSVSVSADDLIERVGILSPDCVDQIEDARRLVAQPSDWTPAAAARFTQMRDALRPSRRARP